MSYNQKSLQQLKNLIIQYLADQFNNLILQEQDKKNYNKDRKCPDVCYPGQADVQPSGCTIPIVKRGVLMYDRRSTDI